MRDSDFLRSVINTSYEAGMAALRNGELESARRYLYKAAENTLLLAKGMSGEARERLIQRADDICAFTEAIDVQLRDMAGRRTRDEEQTGEGNCAPQQQTKEDCEDHAFAPAETPRLTFHDVVGLDDVKDEIRRSAIYPQTHPELYARFKKKRGGGILLYGVPGTGKTMIANATANEIGAAFYVVKCSDILSKWFGEAEQNIKELFAEAKRNPISLIFFDEFEALGTKRDTDSSAMKRIIPELLVEIQKAEESEGIVLIMAATNRPWDIDSAFLRPGRFSTSIHIPLPDAPSRKAIIDAQMADVPRSDDWCVDKSVRLSEGFSGADIVAVCERLKDRAIERVIRGDGASCITDADVEHVFQHTRSSVLKEDLDRIEWYRKQAGS